MMTALSKLFSVALSDFCYSIEKPKNKLFINKQSLWVIIEQCLKAVDQTIYKTYFDGHVVKKSINYEKLLKLLRVYLFDVFAHLRQSLISLTVPANSCLSSSKKVLISVHIGLVCEVAKKIAYTLKLITVQTYHDEKIRR
jgi:hypothetical protein